MAMSIIYLEIDFSSKLGDWSELGQARHQQGFTHPLARLCKSWRSVTRQFRVYTFGEQPFGKCFPVFEFLIFWEVGLELTNLVSCCD